MSSQPVTLKERHWRIFSQAGTFETVKAKGVVGQVNISIINYKHNVYYKLLSNLLLTIFKEPFLTPEQPVFQYSSHVNLQSPSGHMW